MNKCEKCGRNCSSYEKSYSEDKFGKILCAICQKKEGANKAKELWDDRGDDSGKYELEKGGK